MRNVSVALVLLFSPIVWAGDDCTFDQAHQREVLAVVAEWEPGASVNLDGREVTWMKAEKETTVFGYGGCFDLGSTVTRTTHMAAPRNREQVFALAKDLAERFWSNELVSARRATEALVSGLYGSSFTTQERDGQISFNVSDPSYVELYVEHEYANGVDRVRIAWQGNF
jgi:hypothetical protein